MTQSLGEPTLEEAAHSSAGMHNDSVLPPELNPIQNPILASNLGRWAQVYFTSEPEQRDKAVRELISQLEKEQSSSSAIVATDTDSQSGLRNNVCPACNRTNSPSQKFCGFCGMDLTGPSSAANNNGNAGSRTITTASTSFPARSTLNLSGGNSSEGTPELASLRQASFSSMYEEEEPEGQGWKYAVAVIVIVGLLSALAYLQWGNVIRATLGLPPEKPHVNAPAPSTSAPSNTQSSSPGNASQAVQPSAVQSQPPAVPTNNQTSSNASTNAGGAPVAKVPIAEDKPAEDKSTQSASRSSDPAAQTTPAPAASHSKTSASNRTPAATTTSADNGSQELLIAQNYLNGTPGTRNPSIAAQWLWKAVGKQNATALMLLSDLYRNGEGVSKNCDQARLLLVAAAKKGAPDAGSKLRSLESGSCQ